MRSFLISVSLLAAAPFAAAQTAPVNLTQPAPLEDANITVSLGHSQPFVSSRSFNKVVVSDTDMLDVTPISDREFLVRGKSSGRTNILIYRDSDLVQSIDVEVTQDIDYIRADLEALFPEHDFKLRRVAGRIYIEGEVTDADIEKRVISIVESYAPGNVINALSQESPRQVALKVRFLEASRDDVKQLGLGSFIASATDFAFSTSAALVSGLSPNTSGIIYGDAGSVTLDVLINALEEKGTIRTLAEPNLVSSSGQPASFLAGGEFPVPIAAEDNRVTIEFREFGVSLEFEPEVLSDNRVNLQVRPEVSQIDPRNAIRLSGFEIPSLIVRRADTTVELKSGQTFAIAGLLQNTYDNNVIQTPFVGDIPILGSLFRSTRFRENETELIILVTPTLLNSVDEDSMADEHVLSNLNEPSEAELFFMGLVSGKSETVQE